MDRQGSCGIKLYIILFAVVFKNRKTCFFQPFSFLLINISPQARCFSEIL